MSTLSSSIICWHSSRSPHVPHLRQQSSLCVGRLYSSDRWWPGRQVTAACS
jgi:hypothetical protein